MYYDLIVWDDADDPDGNYRHIVSTGMVTTEEVGDVIAGHQGPWMASRSSGLPIITGTASTGRRLGVVFTIVPDPDYVLIRPVTAYPLED
jgi:hypothetical protein